MGRNIVSLFADRVVALACLHANNHRPPATEQEFDLLCWELHNCADPAWSEGAEALIGERLGRVRDTRLKIALANLPPRALLAETFRARTAAFHLEGRWAGLGDFVRPLLIAEHLAALLVSSCGSTAERRLENFLQGSLVEFHRNAIVLNGLLCEGSDLKGTDGRTLRARGLIHLDDGPIGHDELRALGVTGEGVRTLCLRLSRSLESFSELRTELDSVPDEERKFSAHINWLGRWPLLDLGVAGTARRVIAPSPRGFANSIQRFLLYEMPRTIANDGMHRLDGVRLDENNLTSLRGEAYEDYIRGPAVAHGVTDASLLKPVTGKRPDFVWVGARSGILIEAKFTLRPNDDRALANGSAAVTTWERAFEALDQISEFESLNRELLASRWPNIKDWYALIVTNDQFPEETTRFKAVMKRTGLLPAGIKGLALLSTSEFENWLACADADVLSGEIARWWNSCSPESIDDELVLRLPLGPRPPALAEHLGNALERVLPGARFAALRREPDVSPES